MCIPLHDLEMLRSFSIFQKTCTLFRESAYPQMSHNDKMETERKQMENSRQDCFLDDLYDFATTEAEEPNFIERRPECKRCRRPMTVCWCPFLPEPPVNTRTRVFVLQHPLEELRRLKTAPMLYHSLQDGCCHVIRDKKFSSHRHPELRDILRSSNTLLLYPAPDAVDIRDMPYVEGGYNLIVLDGTWTQAKGMYINNKEINKLKKVQITHDSKSKYVIRTQPTDDALSTLESAAIAISVLEDKPQLAEVLTLPLEGMVQFQLDYGAVGHQSKEFCIANGSWRKQLPKKLLKKREREATEKNGYS